VQSGVLVFGPRPSYSFKLNNLNVWHAFSISKKSIIVQDFNFETPNTKISLILKALELENKSLCGCK
jgi:hypothetical protein